MASERSIEVKVGALMLVALGLLGAFVLVMSGLSFERTYTLFVDFDNPGGLQPGATVRISGIRVGKIQSLDYRGNVREASTGRRSLVRAKLAVEQRVRESIHDDADFFVTTQGVLGEPFLAIDPGSSARPVLAEGAIVKGIDPPRLDLFLAKGYELLDTTMQAIKNNKELIGDIATNTAGLVKGLNIIVGDNRERLQRTINNVETLSAEAAVMAREARIKYVENPKIDHTIDSVERIAAAVEKEGIPTLANANRITTAIGGPDEEPRLKKAINEMFQLASKANTTMNDAQAIVSNMKNGKGTVGALLMDEQVYDDVQEMVRDLKHNPWKFLWKE